MLLQGPSLDENMHTARMPSLTVLYVSCLHLIIEVIELLTHALWAVGLTAAEMRDNVGWQHTLHVRSVAQTRFSGPRCQVVAIQLEVGAGPQTFEVQAEGALCAQNMTLIHDVLERTHPSASYARRQLPTRQPSKHSVNSSLQLPGNQHQQYLYQHH